MATNKRPSYLKRQKEQARMARANEKRQARLERKRNGRGMEPGAIEELVDGGEPMTGDVQDLTERPDETESS